MPARPNTRVGFSKEKEEWEDLPMSLRAIVIDPEQRTVKAVETAATTADIRRLVGASGLSSFRIADHGTSFDYGWVNDVGLMDGKPIYGFKFDIAKDPIAGRCVFIGVDKETRENTDAATPIGFLLEHIIWLGLIVPEVFWEETEQGMRAIVTYERAKA
ncbi:hypothetical protein I6F35_06215 [Bradyrhizobium sp. BRP22]|uniref:hypothetical protein n=1 Tax=Bradyrhizobium sp. BRP22 TaxID=2793821 RepID=UPI001CD7A517|nr:hypothetical protein [Bradyrhizobium sp. BRP22]MCA1452814.1 hypothetical protein [Bradyrhizobium sp. BRP22]